MDKENNEENKKKEEEKVIEVYELNQDKKYKKSIFICIISIVLIFIGILTYKNSFIHNNKYSFKFNDTKIERKITEQLKDKFSSDEEIAYFIMDTLTYSKIAEEQGITVTQEEIDEVGKEFKVYQKEIALSNKLLENARKKTENVTEEDLKKLYNETKEMYVKKGTIKFLGLNSESIIDSELTLSNEKIKEYPENESTIEDMLNKGLYPTDLVLNKFILVDISEEEDKQIYRYLYIYEKEITEYYTFEESKDYLLSEYDKKYGAASILEQGYAVQQNNTVEFYQ